MVTLKYRLALYALTALLIQVVCLLSVVAVSFIIPEMVTDASEIARYIMVNVGTFDDVYSVHLESIDFGVIANLVPYVMGLITLFVVVTIIGELISKKGTSNT